MPTGLNVVRHPLVDHRMAELRDSRTGSDRFRQLMRELSGLLAFEAFGDIATTSTRIITPVGPADVPTVSDSVMLVPILRAGLGMIEGIQQVLPGSEVAHLGMRRDEETLKAFTYLDGLPAELAGRRVAVCDPMLATGGSLGAGCRLAAARGPRRIDALCILAAEPGFARFHREFPDVVVTCAALDPLLDEKGFIVPGLGDAGDRLFGPPS